MRTITEENKLIEILRERISSVSQIEAMTLVQQHTKIKLNIITKNWINHQFIQKEMKYNNEPLVMPLS